MYFIKYISDMFYKLIQNEIYESRLMMFQIHLHNFSD